MALTIYGSPRSRTMRVLWTAEELTHIAYEFNDPKLKQPEFLRINPAGAVPTIVDDGIALAESLAINLYLAKTYGRGGGEALYPLTDAGEAQAWRWTLWVQGHIEPWVQQDAALEELRAATATQRRRAVDAALAVLDCVLATRAWLLAEHFTIADLNVAAVLSPSRVARIDLQPFPHVGRWLALCYSRPAAVATRARFASL